MRFDMNNIHTIFESAKSKNCVPSEHADKSGSKIDATLGDSDLIGLFDNICPICGDVFASMKDAAADPKNLKLTMVKTEDLGEATQVYIEAVEFATFCEAADMNVGEAAEEILDTCKGMVPGCNDSELHVVFPSDCLNKGELGSARFGRDVRNDWAMQLLTGCRRYGIHVNSGVEDGAPISENSKECERITEAFFRNDKVKTLKISRDEYSKIKEVLNSAMSGHKHMKEFVEFYKYSDLDFDRNGDGYEFACFDLDDTKYSHDYIESGLSEEVDKDIDSFVIDANKALKEKFKGVRITSDFDGHRCNLYLQVRSNHSVNEAAKEDDLIKKALQHKIKNSSNSQISVNDLDSWDSPTIDTNRKTVDQMSDEELSKKSKDAYYMKKGLPFHEEAMNESTSESKTFKGVKIYIDGPSENIDLAIKLCNKNWSKIVNEAAKCMLKKALSRLGTVDEKFKDVDSVRKNLKLEGVMYDNEGNKYNPICGTMNLSFDTVPSLDPHHSFALYVDFDKDQNIEFDSAYDG